MSPTTIIIAAAATYLLTAAGMLACLLLAAREDRLDREAFDERATRSELYPPSGSVAAATREAPFDAELLCAQDFVWKLHVTEAAAGLDSEWDAALGQGRN